ncbi:MAG: hypothetical protein IJP54_02390 [Synergistaceae bacterium]|nr:hypothetical protein [Synergistaceae bacterium]MBR0034502.1 hypothetical protein [Synergistaceae bacterium]
MKTSRKLAAALAVFAAGSVFFGSLPAQAKAIESDGAKISASRHHGHMPPPEHFEHHGHRGPHPEHFEHHVHRRPHPEHFEHHVYREPHPEHRRHPHRW